MTTDRFQEIKARCAAATPGPWYRVVESVVSDRVPDSLPTSLVGSVVMFRGMFAANADVDFAAHSRADIPWLVAEVERLRYAGKALDFVCSSCGRGTQMPRRCQACAGAWLAECIAEAKRDLTSEVERLRAACFRVIVACGADVDGARTWQEYGESRLADDAARAAADLRDDYQDALKEIPDEDEEGVIAPTSAEWLRHRAGEIGLTAAQIDAMNSARWNQAGPLLMGKMGALVDKLHGWQTRELDIIEREQAANIIDVELQRLRADNERLRRVEAEAKTIASWTCDFAAMPKSNEGKCWCGPCRMRAALAEAPAQDAPEKKEPR